jgi:hypothetical protein
MGRRLHPSRSTYRRNQNLVGSGNLGKFAVRELVFVVAFNDVVHPSAVSSCIYTFEGQTFTPEAYEGEPANAATLSAANLRERQTAQQRVESAHSDELPLTQDSQAVAQSFRLFHVMRGVQDGVAVIAQTANDFQDLLERLRSTQAVGSSSGISLGRCTSETARFRRCFMPPENMPTWSSR